MENNVDDYGFDNDTPFQKGSGDVSVQELTWDLIDDQITGDEFHLLESMLLSDDAARRAYVDCTQLHVDLLDHYAKPVKNGVGGKSPTLSFLADGIPPYDSQPTVQ